MLLNNSTSVTDAYWTDREREAIEKLFRDVSERGRTSARDVGRYMKIKEWFDVLLDKYRNDVFEGRITIKRLIEIATNIVDILSDAR